MKDIRYQNIPLTIPNATVINSLLEANVELDRGYQRITGIQVSVIDNTTLANNLLIGARSNRKTWIDLIPRAAWNAETSVGPDDKFMEIDIPYGSGDTFYLQAQNLAVPGADVQLYMTVRLENSLTELPK
jgi:hypothetical protein